jgi:flavodoxin
MVKVAVVYHSGYGHTERVARKVAEGAGAELVKIDQEGNIPEGDWTTLQRVGRDRIWDTDIYGESQLAVQEICRCYVENVVHTRLAG